MGDVPADSSQSCVCDCWRDGHDKAGQGWVGVIGNDVNWAEMWMAGMTAKWIYQGS